MSGKPGVLLVQIARESDFLGGEDEVTPTYLPYNGHSEKYAEQLENLMDKHARTIQCALDGYYMIRTIRFDSANNLGEAKFAAACLVLSDNYRGIDDSQVVEYDTAGFKELVAKVTDLIKKFGAEPADKHDHSDDYVHEHIDALIYAIGG